MKRIAVACSLFCALFASAVEVVVPTGQPAARGVFNPGEKLFADRKYTLSDDCPQILKGVPFIYSDIRGSKGYTVREGGVLYALTPAQRKGAASQAQTLKTMGFLRSHIPEFQLFGTSVIDRVLLYEKQVLPGEVLAFDKFVVLAAPQLKVSFHEADWTKNDGELLYNGIRLPSDWPPRNVAVLEKSPIPVPYLDHPPETIPIHVGRQLFVDDFLIEKTDLKRTFHSPEKYSGNPVLRPETELELNRNRIAPSRQGEPGNAAAVPKSGGIWWDADEQHFKMWYEAGWINTIALAISRDGVHWERPKLDVRPGTNQVLPIDLIPDSWTVVRNWQAANPAEKWAMYVQPPGKNQTGTTLTSADGIHWQSRVQTGKTGDRSTLFYNPFRKKWVYSLRAWPNQEIKRSRAYYECADLVRESEWKPGQSVFWLRTDVDDLPDAAIGQPPQLYNMDAVAYESLMLGIFELHLGPHNDVCADTGLPKITDLQFAYSRDGFHFFRPDRRAHICSERKDVWDRGYVQSVGSVCVVMGDELWFYYSAFQGDASKKNRYWLENGMYDRGATGLAILRRDGFVSMDAGAERGTLTTRPVLFSGKYLFVNVDTSDGAFRAELLDETGHPVPSFTLEDCDPVSADSTWTRITWGNGSDLSSFAGRPVRLRFELAGGSLYSFWVSKDETGRSDGYVAGGGPGYVGATDTVGQPALVQTENIIIMQ
jgi:hypothetical protein